MSRETAADIIRRAQHESGAEDFGPDGWQRGLEALIAAADRDITSAAVMLSIEREILRRLVNRLEVERWYTEHPKPVPAEVAGPVVIVGPPRTGTTALHHLLAQDARFRYVRAWEATKLAPPPDLMLEPADPRRVAAAERQHDDVRHISSVDGPIEDAQLHAYSFGHQELALPVPTYRSWWRAADLSASFAYHHRLLRFLHAHRPPQLWLLKAPAYLFHLPAMAKEYPDARFVMTHRDPSAVLPSTCSTVLDARRNLVPDDQQNLHALGQEMLEHFAIGIARATAARAAIGERRFMDVTQAQIEHDPGGTARCLYAHIGLPMDETVSSSVAEWAAANRRGSRGVHDYSPEQFGLSGEVIRSAFTQYCSDFAV